MTSVYISPPLSDGPPAMGGIARVVEAMHRYLPAYGWEMAPTAGDADLLVSHATAPSGWGSQYPRKPHVNISHGLYWADYEWDKWALRVNRECFESMRTADAITAVSDWVAQAIRRASSRTVQVIPNGVDLDEWAPDEGTCHDGYVLWDKSRPDPVCDPDALNRLVAAMPGQNFVSTFGQPAPNLILTGQVPYAEARTIMRRAGVYLATTRETFGISTLQALAAGVPVVGWAWAGQAEIMINGVGGILVTPGDDAALQAAVERVLRERETFSAEARALAARWTWEAPIAAYHELFTEVVARRRAEAKAPRTTVIVPSHNLAPYLADTLDSVIAQTDRDWECVVVDDASTDDSLAIARKYARTDKRIRVIANKANVYLAEARNIGIRKAKGRYILPLDADDQLDPNAVATLADALDGNRHLAIAYGGVRFVMADGATPAQVADPKVLPAGYSGWPRQYDHHDQMRARGQQLPYCSLYRREVWAETGGYRRRWSSSEDCDFWTRAAENGWRPAKVTDADTLIYRIRDDSMSQTKGWRDIEVKRWFPGSRDSGHSPAGSVALDLPVPSCDPPAVAVIIPVGPGHERYVIDAIDSIAAQTFQRWECIVVNDTGGSLGAALPSWVRVIHHDAGEHIGPGAARNLGISAARAAMFLPLDADDLLEPQALELMLAAMVEADGATIYTDWWADSDPSTDRFIRHDAQDFDASLLTRGSMHPVTALYPVSVWRAVGGYDEALSHWEDWDFQFRTMAAGHCERRLAVALWTYRMRLGTRREANVAAFAEGKAQIEARWGKYWRGERLMACGCSGNTIRPASLGTPSPRPGGDSLMLTYIGSQAGTFTFGGPATGTRYRFEQGRPMYVFASDAPGMINRGDFEAAPTPTVAAIAELDAPQLVPA